MSSSCVFTNYPLICAFIAFAIAQSTKFFTSWYKERRWDIKQLVGSGGMPSSHSSTVTALATAIGFQEATYTTSNESLAWFLDIAFFVLAGANLGFLLITVSSTCAKCSMVMYDATGVRLHAGRQAEVLNQIVYELPAEHPLAESRPLRELLGHTPPQVFAGGMLGIITSAAGYFIFQSAA
ncbi:hypothetical protein V6N13_017374 [Hibiscus sabdariffa]